MSTRFSTFTSRVPLLIVATITIGLVVWPSVRRDIPAERPAVHREAAVAVTTVTVARRDLAQTYRAIGVITAAAEARVAAQLDGVLRDVLVDVGAHVAKGQPLAMLDDRLLRVDLEQAAAALARSDDERQRVALLAERRLTDARREQAAIAQHRIDQAALSRLETLLELTTFPSPIAGIVTTRLVQPGDHIQTGTPLFTIADVSRLRAVARVPEQVALRLERGAAAVVEVEGVRQPRWRATIQRVHPTSDPVSHQTTVELDLGSAYPSLRPGLRTAVLLTTEQRKDALVLPRTAVPEIPGDGTLQVFVVEDGQARPRTAHPGLVLDDYVEIVGGLAEGDRVIVQSGGRLRDGAMVRAAGAGGADGHVP